MKKNLNNVTLQSGSLFYKKTISSIESNTFFHIALSAFSKKNGILN